MLTSEQNPTEPPEKDINNIVLSLEYLKEEARREGSFMLFEIIQTACVMARISNKNQHLVDIQYPDGSLFQGAKLLLKFLSASKDAQENFMELLSQQLEEN